MKDPNYEFDPNDPFRSIPVPPDLTRIRGCNCGGLDMHRSDCTMWREPREQVLADTEAAHERMRQRTARLTQQLRAFLAARGDPDNESSRSG